MIAQKNTQNAVMRKRGAQLLPLSCLLASLPVLAAEQADKELPKAGETMVVTGTAMKVEVPMAETPRAVSVVNREELDQHAVLSSTSPCATALASCHQFYGSDNNTDWFKVRGFDAASYLDGNRLFSTGYYVWTPEPFGLESVEVLKGPASILYGEAPPGGVINAISKRPTATPQGWSICNWATGICVRSGWMSLTLLPTTAVIVWWPSTTSGTACWMAPTTSAPIWRRA
jgi:iron complex outermembrane receptor protein